eukprot:2697146-Prymnesium_polylepis.1
MLGANAQTSRTSIDRRFCTASTNPPPRARDRCPCSLRTSTRTRRVDRLGTNDGDRPMYRRSRRVPLRRQSSHA